MSETNDRPGDSQLDPTAPPPDAGAPPWAPPTMGGQQPAYGEPPASDPYPYGQQPPYPQQPSDSPPPAYGQAYPYGQPAGYGATPSPYAAPGTYGQPAPSNASALVLTILSGVGTIACCMVTVPALIFGIVALTKQSTDPAGSAKMTRYGWIAFGISMAVAVLAVVAYFALIAGLVANSGSYEYDY